MSRIKYNFLIEMLFVISILLVSCYRTSTVETQIKSDEPKYAHHQDYASFLQYLKDSTANFKSDIDKQVFIRKRVAELIDAGVGGRDFSKINNTWTSANGGEYYNIFITNEATVKCGGTSFFLQNVYRDLGYTSYTLDMGCSGQYTHQVTLVQSKGNQQFYVQDAFHNVSYFDENDRHYLSFNEILTELNENSDTLIETQWDNYRYQPDFDTTGLYTILKRMGVSEHYKEVRKQDVEKMFREQFVEESQAVNNRLNNCLIEKKLPQKAIYLFLIPQEHNSKEVMELYERIR